MQALDEVIKEAQVKEETPSVDLAGRVLLLETKILILESKLSFLEKKSSEAPQVSIYGANRKPKNIK